MIAFAEQAPVGDAPVPQQPRFECATCHSLRIRTDFGTSAGKRARECFVCSRARQTRNRHVRLGQRKCLSCKERMPFDRFPVVMTNGRQRIGGRCVLCAEKVIRVRRRRLPEEGGFVAVNIDFSAVALTMLYPEHVKTDDYRKLDSHERAHVYVLQRMLARRYSPDWKAIFDRDPPPVDLQLRKWAELYLLTATFPQQLLDFIEDRNNGPFGSPSLISDGTLQFQESFNAGLAEYADEMAVSFEDEWSDEDWLAVSAALDRADGQEPH